MYVSQQTQNVWKNCHNYSNLAPIQMLFYMFMYEQRMYIVHVHDSCTKYKQNQILLWDLTTHTQNLWQNGHNYSNTKCMTQLNSILHASAAHGTWSRNQYEENPSSVHGGMCEDRHSDMARWTDGLDSPLLQALTEWALTFPGWMHDSFNCWKTPFYQYSDLFV